jgi:oligosaccharide repeat unit polymerase
MPTRGLSSNQKSAMHSHAVSIWLATVAGVGFSVLLAASWMGPEALQDLAWAVGGAALLFVSALLIKKLIRWFGRQDLFSPLIAFPMAYAAWFTVGALTLDEGAGKVLGYSAGGILCYFAGALLARKPTSKVISSVVQNTWARSFFWPLMAILGIMAVLSYAYVISHVGVIALDPKAAEQRTDLVKYGPAEAVLFTATWTLLIFLAGHLWTRTERRHVRILAWTGLTVIAVMLLSLGSRGYLFVPLLTAVIARHYLRKRFHVMALAALGVVIFMALSFYGYTRDATLSSTFSLRSANANQIAIFPLVYAYLYVRQPVETLHEVMRVIPRTIPYQNGALTFDALRTLLPGHHEMSDMFFKQILGSDFVGGGQPATLLGPLYADFGVFGIMVGMFMVGIIVARTYAWMGARPDVFRILIYAWVMQTILFSLFGALIPYVTTLWIPLFWCLLHAIFRQQPAPGFAHHIGQAEPVPL